MVSTALDDTLLGLLGDDDDPAFWQAALEYILAEVESPVRAQVEVGACSHWLRPHNGRWKAFAWPNGYGPPLHSPQFDWSILLKYDGEQWRVSAPDGNSPVARIVLPTRTIRHPQAAVHVSWMSGKERKLTFYGFQKKRDGWHCTASLDRN